MMDDNAGSDICRVCRSEGVPERPLFHPCICTGSIKWIHQECLMQWMRYSRKEYCELCSHRFSFTPIYSPDMPRRLPLRDVAGGLLTSVATAVKYWLHCTLVAAAWLGVVPLVAYRIYRLLFNTSVASLWNQICNDFLSWDNIPSDVFHGCFVVTCTLFAFICMVWLREQIVHGGGPEWLERGWAAPPNNNNVNVDNNNLPNVAANEQEPIQEVAAEAENEPVGGAEAEAAAGEVDEGADNAQDEGNWNPIEWDRAAEELTWERLLGFDGSLVFLEHVFWVVSLNALFIFLFAFCPYHLGHFALSGLAAMGMLGPLGNSLAQPGSSTGAHFQGLVTTLCGYCIIGLCLVLLHSLASLFNLRRSRRILGLCYVIVKVSLLFVVEIGVLPLICGWWLDICSLAMFDATLKDRELSFRLAPGTSMFLHWLVGMVYVYYFASFLLLLREVLRPGVLWFLINLNDPDFSPIQEMIHLSIINHVRRLLASAIIFGTAVLLMLWLPVKILRVIWPAFLPYTVALQSEAQGSELSLELFLLQVILPALLEQRHSRVWMKGLIRLWCKSVAWLLGMHSYLLGDEPEPERLADAPLPEGAPGAERGVFNGIGAVQALLPRDGLIGVQPYERPSWFYARLLGLLVAVAVSLIVASLTVLTVPVWLGRRFMALWLVTSHTTGPVTGPSAGNGTQTEEGTRVHELYTAACGTYICWISLRAITLLRSWLPQGRAAIIARLRQWCIWGLKSIVAFALLLGLIPLLFGLLLELVVVVPLRVSLDQTPLLFVWQDWVLGVLYTKIACAVIMMGPDWSMRRAIERVYRDGIRNMDLYFILQEVAMPVIAAVGLALAVPYATAYSIVPLVISNGQLRNVIARRLYPCLLLFVIGAAVTAFQIRQFTKLYEHIKNDKYLVGKRLVNYDHRKTQAQAQAQMQKTSQ